LKLLGLADAVLVGVLPDAKFREALVTAVEEAVGVAVEGPQPFKVGDCAGRIIGEGDFIDVVDRAVPIPVEHQHAIIRIDPPGAVGNAILIHVELDG
jgi:hypothetical protein